MAMIIKSVLARAQSQFDVLVCAAAFLGNHFHLLLVTQDPETTVRFVDYVKTELAHAVNKLQGRRRRTVWCSDYDAEPILTLSSAIKKFTYLYTNPQTANLVDTIDEYPGFSTWEMFIKDEQKFEAPWIQRFFINELPNKALSEREDLALCQELRGKSKESHEFKLSPFAWLKCFDVPQSEAAKIKEQIIQNVRAEEARLRAERKYPCVGAEKLRRQPVDIKFTPKKYSRKQWCICDDVEVRIAFIAWVKLERAKARVAYERWCKGERSAEYPPGMFPPSFPKLANLVSGIRFSH
jgi:hypothetical protein